jgi:hypothetical protein
MVVARWRWALAVLALGAASGTACGGSESSGDDDKPAPQAGNGGGSLTAPRDELNDAIAFSPVYSSYDGEHTFLVPVTVKGYTGITWQTDRPDLVELSEVNENTVMIETLGAGEAKIIANAGPLQGYTVLTITESTPEEWAVGENRYANGAILMIDREMAMMAAMNAMNMPGAPPIMIPDDLSCKNCHGTGAMALSVEHTPQQTGGYSDQDLINIFTMGMKPPKAGWKSGIPMQLYTLLHTWGATEEEKRGLVAYLRSLTPAAQGAIDFGGFADND